MKSSAKHASQRLSFSAHFLLFGGKPHCSVGTIIDRLRVERRYRHPSVGRGMHGGGRSLRDCVFFENVNTYCKKLKNLFWCKVEQSGVGTTVPLCICEFVSKVVRLLDNYSLNSYNNLYG